MDALKSHNGHDHEADRRMRELYRYFRPLNHPDRGSRCIPAEDSWQAITSSGDVLVADATGASAEISAVVPDMLVLGSPNKTLNSFAQLAALCLHTEHAFISVSDPESQFILARASQEHRTSKPAECSGEKDSAWPGCCEDDTTCSVCETTIGLPWSGRDSSQHSFLIVNDLSKDERFKGLPFVCKEPNFRFYVGTPLTTDSGINIGCLFVLDKQPRTGLTDSQKEIMRSLAGLVINYLKVSRQADEGRRATRLSHGLRYFVEGNSSIVDNIKPPLPILQTSTGGSPRSGDSKSCGSSITGIASKGSLSYETNSIGSQQVYRPGQGGSPKSVTPLPSWWPDRRGPPLDASHGTTWVFRRAANILRESLELGSDGGVIFLEAGNSPSFDAGGNLADAGEPASVLAISTSEEPFAPLPGSRSLYPATNLGVSFLQQLLRRYSKGKLWSFHRDGMVSSSDESTRPGSNRPSSRKQKNTPSSARSWRAIENSMLNLYFPSACQVLFVPLWNAANSQYFAGCFCWSMVETHVFCPSVELSSVLGFGTSIMAECSRLESQIADRQKGDFIGSISHELRSPLHGILATMELLGGTNLNEFQASLLDTVNACGRTLLDTVNQVLDFSKIVSMERMRRHSKRIKGPSHDFACLDRLPRLDSSAPFDLAILIEEVVEGACVGHAYGQRESNPFEQAVSRSNLRTCAPTEVNVDIEIARGDWIYRAQPGAMRRIIMNIFGNAMKYTDRGRISVHLSKVAKNDSHDEDLVTLTVSDTGRGMSDEFQNERLYIPFSQEDSLASGTGLGLSIVQSLVKSLNGSIKVHSRLGEGTIVKISLPLARANEGSAPPQNMETGLAGESKCGRAAILVSDPERNRTWKIISQYVTDWYDLELVPWPCPQRVDILLADEQGLAQMPMPKLSTLAGLLILSNRRVSVDTIQTKWAPHASLVEIVHQPCGPHKLGKSISRILNGLRRAPPLRTMNIPERTRNSPHVRLQETAVQKTATNGTSVSSTCRKIAGEKYTSRPRVLVVDDNAINLNLMLTFLERYNLETLGSAENGLAAVQSVRQSQHGYDIIFMDLSMPVMDGFEATREIRAFEEESKVRTQGAMIIALTGLSSPKDESEALASGIDLFLTKPVSLKEVARLLKEWKTRPL